MGRGIILYQSKYGATEKYAKWLQEQTSYDIAETKKARAETAAGYDVLIYAEASMRLESQGFPSCEKIKRLCKGKRQPFFVSERRHMTKRRWLRLRRII